MSQDLDAIILQTATQVVEIAKKSLARDAPTVGAVGSTAAVAAEPTTRIEPASRTERRGAGRDALRRAAAVVGVELGEIDRDNLGAAVLPIGLIGSISHTRGVSVAIAARDVVAVRLGVDVERNFPARTRIAQRVLTGAEWREIEVLAEPERWRAILALFCAKEAAFKALDGLVDAPLTFKSLEIVSRGTGLLSVRILVVAPDVGASVAVAQDCELTAAVAAAYRLRAIPGMAERSLA